MILGHPHRGAPAGATGSRGGRRGGSSAREVKQDYQNPLLDQNLTEREIEILKLIAQGMSNKEIGDQLFISHRTVDTHRTNLMKKLDVHNIAGLIRFAIRSGFVE